MRKIHLTWKTIQNGYHPVHLWLITMTVNLSITTKNIDIHVHVHINVGLLNEHRYNKTETKQPD